jgi:hypothetical protein
MVVRVDRMVRRWTVEHPRSDHGTNRLAKVVPNFSRNPETPDWSGNFRARSVFKKMFLLACHGNPLSLVLWAADRLPLSIPAGQILKKS